MAHNADFFDDVCQQLAAIAVRKKKSMKNKDIRIFAMEHGVRLWEIAKKLGFSPETMSRRLRKELSLEEKEHMKQAIMEVANEH